MRVCASARSDAQTRNFLVLDNAIAWPLVIHLIVRRIGDTHLPYEECVSEMPTFKELHHSVFPLVLPNAWDSGSAMAFIAAGFPAIGTTSFGVAASSGMPDGDRSSQTGTLELIKQIGRLPAHVTVDVEDGYSDDPEEVASFVSRLADLGAAGINLEDSRSGHLVDPAMICAKILAIKERAPQIFINARVDNFWFDEEASVAKVLQRAAAYSEAGADGIFVPGALGADDIAALAAGVDLPLNVLAHPALSVAELGELGVRRISSGSLPYRASVDASVNAVLSLRDGLPLPRATSYWDMQERLVAFHEINTKN